MVQMMTSHFALDSARPEQPTRSPYGCWLHCQSKAQSTASEISIAKQTKRDYRDTLTHDGHEPRRIQKHYGMGFVTEPLHSNQQANKKQLEDAAVQQEASQYSYLV